MRKSLTLLHISEWRLESFILSAFLLGKSTNCSNNMMRSQKGVASYSDFLSTFLAEGDLLASLTASIVSNARERTISSVLPCIFVMSDWRKVDSVGSKFCKKASPFFHWLFVIWSAGPKSILDIISWLLFCLFLSCDFVTWLFNFASESLTYSSHSLQMWIPKDASSGSVNLKSSSLWHSFKCLHSTLPAIPPAFSDLQCCVQPEKGQKALRVRVASCH